MQAVKRVLQEVYQSAVYCKSSHSRELTVLCLIPEQAGLLADH